MRPGAENPKFRAFAQKVFTGEIRNRWVDHYLFEISLDKSDQSQLGIEMVAREFSHGPNRICYPAPLCSSIIANEIELGDR